MDGLVLFVFAPFVMSVAVTVRPPAVLSVTLKVFVPELNAALAGKTALVSLEVMPTVSVAVLTTFQKSSTALTVTLNAAPEVWFVGVPVFPVVVPAAAVSPGTSNCSFVNEAALTVNDELVLFVL